MLDFFVWVQAAAEAAAKALKEAAAASVFPTEGNGAVDSTAMFKGISSMDLAVSKAAEAANLLSGQDGPKVDAPAKDVGLTVDVAEEAVGLLEVALRLVSDHYVSSDQPRQQAAVVDKCNSIKQDYYTVLDALEQRAVQLLNTDDEYADVQSCRDAAMLFQLVIRLASNSSVSTNSTALTATTGVLTANDTMLDLNDDSELPKRLKAARYGAEQAERACELYQGLLENSVASEKVALLPAAEHETGPTAMASIAEAGITDSSSKSTDSTQNEHGKRLRVVSTTLVQDDVSTDSAPAAVLHAGDTVEVYGVALDRKGKLRYRVSISETGGRQNFGGPEAASGHASRGGWVSEETASGQMLVHGVSLWGKQGISKLVRGVSSRLLSRKIEETVSELHNEPQDHNGSTGVDLQSTSGVSLEAELDVILATSPADEKDVVVEVSEAAAAVEARRSENRRQKGCCIAVCQELCGLVLALGGIVATIAITAVVASAGGPYLLALLLCSAATFSAWFTWLVLPPIRGFAMRLTATTTFMGFLITSGMFVLLPIDVATYNSANTSDGSNDTQKLDTLSGFVGVTPSTLQVVWTPLYWLSSLLGVTFTFVVYYLTSGYLTHAARLKATLSKLVWMKVYTIVAGVIIVGVVLYVGEVQTLAKASLLLDLLKVILVSTYMMLQTLCMGAGLVSIPRHLFVGNLRQHNLHLTQQCADKQESWRQSTERYYRCWEAAEITRLQLSRGDPHRALMGLLTYDQFALSRYVTNLEVERRSTTLGITSPVVRASIGRSRQPSNVVQFSPQPRRSVTAKGDAGKRDRFRMVSCDFGRLSVLEKAVDARNSAALSKVEALDSQKLLLIAELEELQMKPKPAAPTAAAERAGQVRQLKDALAQLRMDRKLADKGSQLVWKTHTELAQHRMTLEQAKHSMDQLAEDIVDIEMALDWANSRSPSHYAQWRCWRCTLGFGACAASLVVFLSCTLGVHAARRWPSPLSYFVLLDNDASSAWRLFASALSLLYMGLATYTTLFGVFSAFRSQRLVSSPPLVRLFRLN